MFLSGWKYISACILVEKGCYHCTDSPISKLVKWVLENKTESVLEMAYFSIFFKEYD